MKKIYSLIIVFAINLFIHAQAPGWQWAMGGGAAGTDEAGNSIATDAAGNVYSTGSFACNTLSIGSASVTKFGSGNAYVVKQDASGNVQWLKRFGGASSFWGGGNGKGICADASGNVYVTGFYLSTMVAGSTTLTATDSSASNVGDIFIVKMDASGNVVWAKSAGGAYGDGGNDIAVDASGNVFITGYFKSRYLRFGSLTVFSANNSSSNLFTWTDFFVAKYDASGNPVWAQGAGTASLDDAKGICIDAANNVLVAGQYNMGSMVIGSTTVTGTSANNLFIAKYDNAGIVQWSRTATGAGSGAINHYATGITTDAGNNVYFTGNFIASTLTIGSITVTKKGGTSATDFLVAKLDASGNAMWVQNGGGGTALGTGIARDNSGDIYVTGYFDGMNCVFGNDTVKNKNTGGNNEDIFVAKYSSNGNLGWATGAGANFRDISNGIAVDQSGNAHITGFTTNTLVAFGTLSITCTGGLNDLFIAKIGNLTGMNEFSESKTHLNVYPNPSNGIFYVRTEPEASRIEIVNMMGQTLLSLEGFTNEAMIDISDKPKGIYFVNLISGRRIVATGKVIAN